MPVAGFMVGDLVATPSGAQAIVARIVGTHPQEVEIEYVGTDKRKVFRVSALRPLTWKGERAR